ncbi:MAG TPA: SDR family oxidoreductase [Caulobacteraceae bacterium]|nr:SDR family oxidoreductase [Caulobacteraceae bacterium]
MKPTGNTILITGGGSGIGEALAHRLHDQGNTVIVAGRRLEALEKACEGRADMSAIALDVDSKPQIEDFIEAVLANHPKLNVLINNAGVMRFEDLDHARDLTDAEETISTNLLGPIRLIDGFVDHLKAQADSAIINITSGLAFVPLVAAPTYCATKAAMHSYTVSLREALKGQVEVIELAPPGVQTDLTPGQSSRQAYMPLKDFADEAMARLSEQPTPSEIAVQRAQGLRTAEAEHRFESTFQALNEFARQAREAQKG